MTLTTRLRAVALIAVLGLVGAVAFYGARNRPNPVMQRGMLATEDGVQLHYALVGTGADTIVVLHGGPGFHAGYLIGPLAPLGEIGRHALLFYDMRGRGRSALVDTARITADADVDDLESVRKHFALGPLSILAHGWGAAVAVRYAAKHPQMVQRIAMVSPMVPRTGYSSLPIQPTDGAAIAALGAARRERLDSLDPVAFCRDFWGWQYQGARVTDRRVVSVLAPGMCDAPPAALRRVQLVNRQIMRSLGPGWDLRGEAAQVSATTLIVEGTRGRDSILIDAAREWSSTLKNAHALLLDAPSVAPWVGDDDEVLRALGDFFGPKTGSVAHAPRSDSGNPR